MNLVVVSGSTRKESSSIKVAKYIKSQLADIAADANIDILSLASTELPMWDENTDVSEFAETKALLANADGFVFIVPEWHGMVPPAVKNLFFLFSGVFRHKPAFLVGVSSGTGGRYPLPEMRSTTYKNSFINYIPVNTVIDRVNTIFDDEGQYIAEKAFVQNHLDEGLRLLDVYSRAFQTIRDSEIVQEKRFPNGV